MQLPSEPTVYLDAQLIPDIWLNVTKSMPTNAGRLKSANVKRGKNKALDDVSAGSLTVALKNHDRELDPEHNSFFELVKPGLPVRLRAEYPNTWTDDFARPDNVLSLDSPFWTAGGTSVWGLSGGKAYKVSTNAVHENIVMEAGTNRGTAEIVVAGGAATFPAVVGRYISESNHWFLQAQLGASIVYLCSVAAGVLSVPITWPVNVVAGDRLALGFEGNEARAYVNDVLIGTYDTAGLHSAGTKWGMHLYYSGAGTSSIESFTIAVPINYPLFTGKLDRVIDRDLGPHNAEQIWECYDGLADLESANLPSVWEAYMNRKTTRIWLPLGESSGPYAFDRSGNARHGVYVGTPNYGVNSVVFSSSEGAVEFSGGDDALIIPATAFPTTLPWTMQLWIYGATNPVANQIILYQGNYPDGLVVWIDTLGRVNVQVSYGGVITAYARTTSGYMGGANGGPINIMARAGLPLAIMSGLFDDSTAHIGTGGAITGEYPLVLLSGANVWTFDNFYVLDYTPDATEITDESSAMQSWLADSPNGRVARILDYVGWDITARSVDLDLPGQFLKGTDLNTTALDHIQTVTKTMEGRLWVDADGFLWIHSARGSVEYPWRESAATYGDDPSELPYVELGDSTRDWELLTNVVRRYHGDSVMGETVVVAADAASITEYGQRDTSPVADVTSELYPLDMEYDLGMWRVAHYKEPRDYIDGITVYPRKNLTLWPRVLGDDLNTRLAVIRRPQGIGAPKVREVVVEGLEHSIGPKKWTVSYRLDSTNAQSYFLFDFTEWDSEGWRFTP